MSDTACCAVDQHGLAFERHRLVPVRLQRVGRIVPELDHELPGSEQRHRRRGGMQVIDAARLACQLRRRHADPLGIGPAVSG